MDPCQNHLCVYLVMSQLPTINIYIYMYACMPKLYCPAVANFQTPWGSGTCMKVEILISSLALINNRNSHIIAHCKCFPPRHSCLCRTGEEGEDGGVVLSKWLLYINMFKTTVMVISLQALIVGMYVMVILYFEWFLLTFLLPGMIVQQTSAMTLKIKNWVNVFFFLIHIGSHICIHSFKSLQLFEIISSNNCA